MSNRDSLGFGDLIPQDVVDIFAQEKHVVRGQKKRSRSLGRALGWLKGKKRKDLGANRQGLGLGPALDLALDGHPAGHQSGHKGGHKGGQRSGRQAHPQGNSHANPKHHDDDKTPAPPLLQENVFIEASRPKYLENLHTEALEGLKMMQQEETNNGVEYQDNESTISTMTVQTDGEGGGFMTDSTIGDTTSVASVQSSVSSRSSRSGLTRQGSTFRPLKSEKAKTRRRHRKTVAGIPQHVQMELGLDRGGWTMSQKLDEEPLYNGESDEQLSPTTDGPHHAAASEKGAGVSPQNVNAIQPLNKQRLKQLGAFHAGHRDDMALLQCLGPDPSGEQRPRSLAVPGMTTANSRQPGPPSPVMSMSPQAPYLSKILPNAVLPPSIDVVEISRGRSRNSVRTVSKSSLLVSSPVPSRASSRASSTRTTSSRASTINSASRYNPLNMSDSSCWSNSESSETLVSDSSTISSGSTSRQKRSPDIGGSAKDDQTSSMGKYTSNGKAIITGEENKEGPFVRSLSVMKPKRAPPPPNRSYSLHKMKRRSRDLAEVKVISGESSHPNISASGEEKEKKKSGSSPMSPRIDSPGYNADTSSLDESSSSVSFSPIRSQLQAQKAEEAAKAEETISKEALHEKQEPLRESKLSKIVSPSSGYSSQDGTSAHLSKHPRSSSPRHKRGILAKLQRLFPKPSTPPPLSHPEAPENTSKDLKLNMSVDAASVSPSVRTLIELFNIPPHPKVRAPPPPPPEVWAHNKRTFELLLGPPAPDNLHAIIKKNPKDKRQQRRSPSASTDGSVKSLVLERQHKNPTATVESINGSLHAPESKKVLESVILNAEIIKENKERRAEQNVDLKGNRKVTEKDEKARVSDVLNGMLVKAVERREERLATVREEEAKTTQATEASPGISFVHIHPSPSPAPVHNPPQPPTKQTAGLTSVASGQVASPEMSWPPPPPPMGLGGPDELDFPLPPPPMFGEEGLVIPVQVPPEKSVPDKPTLSTTTSVIAGMKTESVRVTSQAEPQKLSPPQGIVNPPLNIPPPPPYTAPPPPVAVSPLPVKKVSLPPIQEVSLPPIQEVSLPPPPKEVFPPPPTEIPPPPPKEVSPPPPKEVSPPPKEVSPPPPPPKEVSSPPPPPPKEVSPPPKEVSPPPPPPKDVSAPPPPKEVSLPPAPKEVSPPPPPKEVPPPPPKEVSPPPPTEVPPPPKEVSPPPPTEVPPPPKEVSPPPPTEVPPPPPKEVSPPPLKEVPPPPPNDVFPPLLPKYISHLQPTPLPIKVPLLPSKEVFPPPPEEIPPPPSKEISPPPPKQVSVMAKESPSPLIQESTPPQVKVASSTLVTVVSPSPVEEVSPPLFKAASSTLVTVVSPSPVEEVSPPLVIKVSPQSTEEVSPPCSQENAHQSPEKETLLSKINPPQSIPPPPLSEVLSYVQENVPSELETNPVSYNSVLTPPQSIPPPPPIHLLNQTQVSTHITDGSTTQEVIHTPPIEVSIQPAPENSHPEKAPEPVPTPPVNIPLPPPLPEQGLTSIKHQRSPASTENKTPEMTSVVPEEPTPAPVVTPSLLQMVKLRSVNNSPEPPNAQEQPEVEVTMRNQQPSNQVPTSSAGGEAPQKPIRKSLIITSPPSTSPPAIVTSQLALPKSQAFVVPPVSSSDALSPTKKSPPPLSPAPSMNLQEAIRLRTAARSYSGPAARLSFHSQTSPTDIHKSPTSTASFIFSKSNKKVVIETKPASESKTTAQKNAEVSPVTKVVSEAESVKKGVKVPPPVAKKPKTKGKEMETSEGTEQTAGQGAPQESIKDAEEKTNGTAGTVERGETASA